MKTPIHTRSKSVTSTSSGGTALALLVVMIAAGFWLVPKPQAQLLDTNSWPGNPPETIDVFVGWDFTGMTEEDQAAFWGIMTPPTDEEIESTLTPDQVLARRESAFAITHPEEHARIHPVQLTPDQEAETEFQIWAITHPKEAQDQADQSKSPEQVEAERAQDWLMLHPAEALQFFGHLATPDELTAQILAIMTADDLEFRPKPIMRTVRFEEARAIADSIKPRN